ncbi:MAG TPA: cytochrome b [Polaromonas sp.]|uniref:cytochrome b n=1 Tax=Polaromonas sp. TaxID=1869339 RepID=UPI002D5CCBF9|nr:cytochrome b [Polaromonas sp.]HYW57365.1 cytochrome b [Polaromonas sp.]
MRPDHANSPPVAYTRTAIVLHGTMAVLLVAGFSVGFYMVDLPLSPLKLQLYSYHKWIGLSIAGFLLFRLAWRARHAPPPLPALMPALQTSAAHVSHLLLYVLMFCVPVSGWLMSSAKGVTTVYFGLWALPNLLSRDEALGQLLGALHVILNYTLLCLVALHVAAALKHHFIDRDGLLGRMFRFNRAHS